MLRKSLIGAIVATVMAFAPLQARAGIPVIDAANLAQSIQQVMAWAQQYQQMVSQINQARAQYQAITGGRGMEALLPISNIARNYLPPDYAELMNAVNGVSSTYAGLSGQVQSIMSANAILTNGQLGTMSPEMRQIVERGRSSAAMLSAMTQTSQQNTSQRFAQLQQLITRIGGAGDDKAIQDLQGRIGAEQAMLTNEANKMQALYQTAQAEQLLQQQRIRERSTSDVGSVNSLAPVAY